jgi:serine/threonine protein kinase
MATIIGNNKILTTVYEDFLWKIVKAESVTSGEQIWFKILADEYGRDPEMTRLFHDSAELSIALDHENILKTYEHGSDGALQFIVMQSFDGISLAELINREKTVEEQRAIRIVLQICRGLQFAHISGVNHGAITSNSIFINRDDQIVITNFGCDRIVDSLIHKRENVDKMQLASYLPPERLKAKIRLNSRCELYSVGVIFYELLTGKNPFEAKLIHEILQAKERMLQSPRVHSNNISIQTDKIVIKLLAKDPEKRFPNFINLIQALAPSSIEELEELHADQELGVTIKGHSLTSWLALKLNSPVLVGSKRRMLFTFITLFIIILLAASVFLLSDWSAKSDEADLLELEKFTAEAENAPDQEDTASFLPSGGLDSLYSTPAKQLDDQNSQSTNRTSVEMTDVTGPAIKEKVTGPTVDVPQSMKPGPIAEPVNQHQRQQASGSQSEPDATAIEKIPDKNISFATLKIIAYYDSSAIDAEIFVDNEPSGKTSGNSPFLVHGLVARRNYNIRVHKEGFKTWEQNLTIPQQDTVNLSIPMEVLPDAVRRITFAAVDFANRIIVDNKLPSQSLPYSVDLPLGVHKLLYVDQDNMFSWATDIFVDMESSNFILFDADQIGFGQLSITLQDALHYGFAFVAVDGKSAENSTTPARLRLPVGRHHVSVFRNGFQAVPEDTVVFVPLNGEERIEFQLVPKE